MKTAFARGVLVGLAVVLGGLALAGPAGAEITTPSNNQTINRNFTITEDDGGTSTCGSGADTIIRVSTSSGGWIESRKGGPGAYSWNFDTRGVANGSRTVKSSAVNSVWNPSTFQCQLSGERELDSVNVVVDNGSSVTYNAVTQATTGSNHRIAGAAYAEGVHIINGGISLRFCLTNQPCTTVTADPSTGAIVGTMRIDAPAGTYTMTVYYDGWRHGTQWYRPSSVAVPFQVLARHTRLQNTFTSPAYDGEATVSARLTDALTGNAVGGKGVLFEIAGVGSLGQATTDGNGYATLGVPDSLPVGDYSIRSRFAGDAYYLAADDTDTITLLRRPSSLVYTGPVSKMVGTGAGLSAKLTDTRSGAPVSGATIRFVREGAAIATATTGNDGVASAITQIAPPRGSFTLETHFDQAGDREAAADADTFTVLGRPTALAGARRVLWSSEEQVGAELRDTLSGNVVAGASVGFAVGSDPARYAVTRSDGIATTTFSLEPGTYRLRVFYLGDSTREPSESVADLEVLPRPTALRNAGAVEGTWGDTAEVAAVLTDQLTGDVLPGRAVVFEISGFGAPGGTDERGHASVELDLGALEPGVHQLTARFPGQARYTAASITVPFEIRMRTSILRYTGATEGARGSAATVSAVLSDQGSGEPLAGRKVSFELGSQKADAVTDSAGRAAAQIDLSSFEPGTYQVIARFAAEQRWTGAEAAADLEVRWEHVFEDSAGRGTVFLNPSTKEFRIQTPEGRTGILRAPSMDTVAGAVVLPYHSEDVTVEGTFSTVDGAFQAGGKVPFGAGVVQLHSAPVDL